MHVLCFPRKFESKKDKLYVMLELMADFSTEKILKLMKDGEKN